MSPRTDRSAPRWPVLLIGTDRVEWFDGQESPPRYLEAAVEEPTPVRLARAAAQLLRRNKVRRRACVLALGHGMLEQRTVAIADLPIKDSRRVLHRKAANLLEAPLAETLYAAVPLARDADSRTAVREWLLLAMRRREARALQLELRRLGIKVVRVVSARMAKVAAAAEVAGSEEEAVVCLGAGSRSVAISLVAGGELVQQAVISGGYADNPTMAGTLLQELRSFEAFWRKRSRGGSLGRVVLVGFTRREADQLSPAVHAALPGVVVQVHPGAGDGEVPLDRATTMLSALATGDLQVDLSLPLPPRVPRLVSVALVTATAVTALAWKGREHFQERTLRHRMAIDSLRERTSDAAQLDEQHARIEAAIQALEAERARFEAVMSHGIDLQAVLAEAAAACRGRAALLNLSVDPPDGGGAVLLGGVTTPDPGASLLALRAIVADLEAGAHFERVSLIPPTGVPRGEDGSEALLEFAIEAVLAGAHDPEEEEGP